MSRRSGYQPAFRQEANERGVTGTGFARLGKEAMVFHAGNGGGRRTAATLLRAPVSPAPPAPVAPAQYNPVPPQVANSGTAMAGKPSGDAKAMLKEGRKALAAGQFDRAQDLARAA